MPRAIRVGLLAVFVFALLPACGRKTPPKAPELVRPETIDNLAATQDETGIVLSWGRPNDYVDGSRMSDLGTFTVERADGDGPFQPIKTLEVTDRERFQKVRRLRYTDTTTTAGQLYRYRVLSSTLDDYVSAPSNVAEITAGVPATVTPMPATP